MMPTAWVATSAATPIPGGSGRSYRSVTFTWPAGSIPITTKLASGMKPSRCGTRARSDAGESTGTGTGLACAAGGACGFCGFCGDSSPAVSVCSMSPACDAGKAYAGGIGRLWITRLIHRNRRGIGLKCPCRQSAAAQPGKRLQGDAEQGVDGFLAEPGSGDVVRSDPGGRLGQQRVGPAIDDDKRMGSIEVVVKARPHSGQDAELVVAGHRGCIRNGRLGPGLRRAPAGQPGLCVADDGVGPLPVRTGLG